MKKKNFFSGYGVPARRPAGKIPLATHYCLQVVYGPKKMKGSPHLPRRVPSYVDLLGLGI